MRAQCLLLLLSTAVPPEIISPGVPNSRSACLAFMILDKLRSGCEPPLLFFPTVELLD